MSSRRPPITPPARRHPLNQRYPVTSHPFAPAAEPPPAAQPHPAAHPPFFGPAPLDARVPCDAPPPPPYVFSPISRFDIGASSCDDDSTDSDVPGGGRHPEQLDGYMPPVDMRAFEQFGFAYVDPEATSLRPLVQSACLFLQPPWAWKHRRPQARTATPW
jgi:hypothetical protein